MAKITVPKRGQTFKGMGYNNKVKVPKDPTYLPTKKVTPKDVGINVIPGK